MRVLLLAAAGALCAAACSPGASKAETAATPPSREAAEADAPDQVSPQPAPPPDEAMKAAAAAEAAAGITPDNHTFHTAPKKVEIVRLPMAGGGVWSAEGYADGHFFDLLDSKDDTTANGSKVHAVRFEMIASGNGRVIFQKRATGNPNDPVLDVRTVRFMIH